MTLEWIRFFITAALLLIGMTAFTAAVLGANRFGFSMNRMHAAGIGDTMGILFIISGLLVADGLFIDSLKLILIVVFMWFTSPVASHFLIQIEYYTNPDLYRYMKRKKAKTGKNKQK